LSEQDKKIIQECTNGSEPIPWHYRILPSVSWIRDIRMRVDLLQTNDEFTRVRCQNAKCS
jgi:hypothetical protein